MMCEICQYRPASCGSVFCEKCRRWESAGEAFGVAVAALIFAAIAIAVQMCGG